MSKRFKHKRTLLIPPGKLAAVNEALEYEGFGPDSFSVELEGQGKVWFTCEANLDDRRLSIIEAVVGSNNGESEPKKLREVMSDRGLSRKKKTKKKFLGIF